ncbi:MAG: CYCXC family (seleno)protein [Terracidiphilus sp.]
MFTLIRSRALLALAVFVLTAASYAQWTNPAYDVPAYHPSAPLKVSGLPPILSGSQLTGPNFQYPWQVHVYQQAAKIGNVLYQLPCNCRCDRSLGHTSLRSCYEGLHGAECSTCAQEALYAYRMTKEGKSPAIIRAGIARHEYESIDLEHQ